jgi:ABC-type uncharacterized transport system substrate-binding protein
MYRFSDGYAERLPSLAEEVVRLKPDVILATAPDTAVAVRKLTSTIPIVTGALADPVHLGLMGKTEAKCFRVSKMKFMPQLTRLLLTID